MYDSIADAVELAIVVIVFLGMAAFAAFIIWLMLVVLFTF